MTQKECELEKEQLKQIHGIEGNRVGFVCSGGFDFPGSPDDILIDGNALYAEA